MKHNVFGLMLATTVALSTLAGCKAPMTTQVPGSTSNGATSGNASGSMTGNTGASGSIKPGATTLAPAKAADAKLSSAATAEALNDEQDAEAYDAMDSAETMGLAAKYSVFMEGAAKPADGMMGITASADGEAKADDKGGSVKASGKGGGKLGEIIKTRVGGAVDVKVERQPKLTDEQKDALKALAKVKLDAAVKAKLEKRDGERAKKLEQRLDKLEDARGKMRAKLKDAAWVKSADGTTETRSYSFEETRTVNGKTFSRSVDMQRTRSVEAKQLISFHVAFTQQLPGGLSRTSTRDKVLQADGSYLVTFHGVLTLANGAVRESDWTKTIAADGTVSGTGTISWTNKDGKVTKTVTVTINGTEDKTTCVAKDEDTKTEAEVTAGVDGTTTVENTDTATGATETTTATVDASGSVAADGTTASAGTQMGIAVGEPNPAAGSTVEAGTSASGDVSTK